MGTNVPIVKCYMGSFVTIGYRLREERERLGWNQTEFANVGGVGRKSQFNYEEGERQPDAAYLAAIAAAGADVAYILTGQRNGQGIAESAVHRAVLDAVDLLSLEKKVDATQLAKAVVKLLAKTESISKMDSAVVNVTAQGGSQAAGRDIQNSDVSSGGGRDQRRR